jgi:hypothetical protein
MTFVIFLFIPIRFTVHEKLTTILIAIFTDKIRCLLQWPQKNAQRYFKLAFVSLNCLVLIPKIFLENSMEIVYANKICSTTFMQ